MRMHCQFCQKELFLIRRNDPRHNRHEQQWECKNHPSVQSVVYHVNYKEQSARSGGPDGERIYGTLRLWRDTVITWQSDNGRIYEAHYHRYQHRDHPNSTEPYSFQVVKVPHEKESLNWSQRMVFQLKEHPTNLNPENIISKIQTYVVFS